MFCVMWLTSDTRADYIFASKLMSDATTSWVIEREKKKMWGFTCGNHSFNIWGHVVALSN